eukprot:3229109-Heterocapsa_arctica.AAC.1
MEKPTGRTLQLGTGRGAGETVAATDKLCAGLQEPGAKPGPGQMEDPQDKGRAREKLLGPRKGGREGSRRCLLYTSPSPRDA